MKDQLYKMMKQVGDPTVFTEMLNEVQSQIDAEEAAKEQRDVNLDNARAALCEALVCYCEELFNIEEEHAGEHDEMVDKFYELLAASEGELLAYMNFMDGLKKFEASHRPAQLKHGSCSCSGHCNHGSCSCGGHCNHGSEPEKTIDTPEAHIEVHKIPVRKDIDVDTVINEFLKSLQ